MGAHHAGSFALMELSSCVFSFTFWLVKKGRELVVRRIQRKGGLSLQALLPLVPHS